MTNKLMNWLKNPSENSATAAIVLLLLGGIIVVGGYDYLHGALRLRNIVEDFYANASTELISIAITVLVIDQLNQRRNRQHEAEQKRIAQEAQEEQEKKRLILQMGSPNNAVAIEAVRELKINTWGWDDETLDGAYLAGANLQRADLRVINLKGAVLFESNLQDADLFHANLERVNLIEANLQNAKLGMANLQDAQMYQAKLQGADLRFANLQSANLREAVLDETTILPDESNYDTEKGLEQLRRFTDPDHPEFWRPEPFLGTDKYPWWYDPNDKP